MWAEIIIAGIENALLLDRLANNNQLIHCCRKSNADGILAENAWGEIIIQNRISSSDVFEV